MNPLVSFFIERVKRSLLASAGLMMFAFGYYLQIVANIGLSPWTALNDGLALRLPLTLGQASIIVSILIVPLVLVRLFRIGKSRKRIDLCDQSPYCCINSTSVYTSLNVERLVI